MKTSVIFIENKTRYTETVHSQRVCLLDKIWRVKCIGMIEKAIACWMTSAAA